MVSCSLLCSERSVNSCAATTHNGHPRGPDCRPPAVACTTPRAGLRDPVPTAGTWTLPPTAQEGGSGT
eukprot:3889151-Rhodomonas_salina.3